MTSIILCRTLATVRRFGPIIYWPVIVIIRLGILSLCVFVVLSAITRNYHGMVPMIIGLVFWVVVQHLLTRAYRWLRLSYCSTNTTDVQFNENLYASRHGNTGRL